VRRDQAMPVQDRGEGQPAEPESGAETSEDGDEESGPAVIRAWPSRRFRISVIAAAVILAAGVGFGAGRVMRLGDTVVLAGIPRPATTATPFVEDDEGIGQDIQANILESTAPGMVHVLSGGASVGIGLVLTESGKVLTTYQPAAGTARLAAEYVLSRQTFKATVIGADPAAGLALLQLEGGQGRPFATVTVGNSATLGKQAQVARERSYHLPGQIYDAAVGTTSSGDGVSIDSGTLVTASTTVTVGHADRSGLMASALQADMPSAIGGPLVDPNGRVIGITIGGSGSGLDVVGYAIPVNTALAVAAQIDARHS
jgi:S1-C subfamily serine protease